jgi:integrase
VHLSLIQAAYVCNFALIAPLVGLSRKAWSTTEPIREIFRRAFSAAGLPYYNPHSFRDMLVHHAMTLDLTPEQMKAWSQNLGHADVLTTLTSYGQVPVHRQGELIRSTVSHTADRLGDPDVLELIRKIGRKAGK